MLYYPQLPTGAIAQYPISRNNIRRTVANTLADGTQITMADPGAAAVSWTLTYAHLTTSELNALTQLFAAAQGRWQTFTFLDPTDNLLNWSEDLSQADWRADPLLTISSGFPDAVGGTSGWRLVNTAQGNQQMVQTLAIPPSYQYCFSLYVRSDAPCPFSAAVNGALLGASATTSWTRLVFPVRSGAGSGNVAVGVSLPAGGSLYVFGLQLEAQGGAGGYKVTESTAGVYAHSRFDQDVLTTTAAGVGQFSATVKIAAGNVAG